jgi:hypothetical protein
MQRLSAAYDETTSYAAPQGDYTKDFSKGSWYF